MADGDDEHAAIGLAAGKAVVLDAWLGAEPSRALRLEVRALVEGARFASAGIGGRGARVLAPTVRLDRVCWFDRDDETAERPGMAVTYFLERVGALVAHLNRTCFLALQRVECHAACYDAGAFYAAHTDTIRGDARRVISYCYYLNDAWTPAAGGELRLHGAPDIDVAPVLDRIVLFRSDAQLHEVLPTTERRLSLTGWLSRARAECVQ